MSAVSQSALLEHDLDSPFLLVPNGIVTSIRLSVRRHGFDIATTLRIHLI